MRERLLVAFVGLSLLTTLLYGIPRAFIVADQTRTRELRDLATQADVLQALIDAAERRGSDVDVTVLGVELAPEDGLRFLALDGSEVAIGTTPPGPGSPSVQRRTDAGTTLEVWRSGATIDRRVVASIVPIVAIGLIVIVVAVLVAWVLSRRLARPLQQLAAAAEQLGQGRFDLEVPDQDIREAAAIATALRSSAARIGRQLRQEQEFASTASHQLRTPLTGLRLRLESLVQEPELTSLVRADLEAAITEVDRMSGTVSALLDMARTATIGSNQVVDLDGMLADVVARWQPHATRSGRSILLLEGASLRLSVPPTVLDQALDVLVENALRHGKGDITVHASRADAAIRIRVTDRGNGIDPELTRRMFQRDVRGPTSTGLGIGLALARQLVETVGGRLVMVADPTTCFDILLPTSIVAGPDRAAHAETVR